MQNEFNSVNILKINKDSREEEKVFVPSESEISIYLNNKELCTIQATPQNLNELAAGFLYFEGIIKNKEDILEIGSDNKTGIVYIETKDKYLSLDDCFASKRHFTSGCGKGISFSSPIETKGIKKIDSDLKIEAELIYELQKSLNENAKLYSKTGGIHSSALCFLPPSPLTPRIICFEDIGRHNALDKIMGYVLLNDKSPGVDRGGKIILTSGRISSEMLLKCARMSVPIIASRTSPTDIAVKMGEELGISLIGYLRPGRMNVYSCFERIL
ncbi:MAG: formate dehydrogenase accessory sulfurtransferase FdhD [Actinobacteria bacterium]|nr:formate dehydrogenase accessory sulfurtransferase FdhD [Actinomycetota bacterium]